MVADGFGTVTFDTIFALQALFLQCNTGYSGPEISPSQKDAAHVNRQL
jgi:hypothetical protein